MIVHAYILRAQAFLRNQPSNLNLSEDVSREPETDADEETKNAEATKSPADALAASPTSTPSPAGRHPPLRFVFSGYSLWLELEQEGIDADGRGDLDRAMIDAADRFRLGGAIPSPHVTALYGIDTIDDEEEVRRMFRDDVTGVLMETAERKGTGKMWPDLDATGMIVDVEFDGVNGGKMVRLCRGEKIICRA